MSDDAATTRTSVRGAARLVAVESGGGELCVRLSGEVDISNAGGVAAEVRALDADRHERIVVDLTDVTYLDSAGLTVLVELANGLRARRSTFACIAPAGSRARRLIELTGLSGVLAVRDRDPDGTP